MRLSLILGGVAASMLLAACNHAAAPDTPSSAATAAVATAPGTGVIRGRGLARMPAAELLTCAGFGVLAVPSQESTWNLAYRTGLHQLLMDDQLAQLAATYGGKSTKCNSDGRFVISDLSPGHWIVVTPIAWRLSGGSTVGCEIMSEAAVVTAGKTVDIVVTHDFVMDTLNYCNF